jgi:hypothetical protein
VDLERRRYTEDTSKVHLVSPESNLTARDDKGLGWITGLRLTRLSRVPKRCRSCPESYL